jgi:hypothetical protein
MLFRIPLTARVLLPFVLLLGFSTLYVGCGSDSGSEPELPSDPPLVTETIGAAGGRVETPGLVIEVPAGAFGDDQTLQVYAVDDHPYADRATGDIFRLRGLPADHAAPIPLRLAHGGELEGESYILVGFEKEHEDLGQPITDFVWLAAADSNGALYAELPAATFADLLDPDKDDPEDLILYLIGITDMMTITYPQDDFFLFRIRYPRYLQSLMPTIQDYVYQGLLKHEQLGVKMSFAGASLRPISHILVTISPLESWFDNVVAYAFLHGDPLRDEVLTQPMRLNINEEQVTQANLPTLRTAIGKELFDHSHYLQMRTPSSEYWWLRDAVKTYLEEHYTDTPGHVPGAFVGRETALLGGIASIDDPDRKQDYAYAFASAIRFAYADCDTALRRMYSPMRAYAIDSEMCLGSLFQSQPWAWFPDYIRALVTEEIYELDQGVFLRDYAATHDISAAGDTLWSVRRNMGRVSAEAVRVNLNWADISLSDTLHIRASDPHGASFLQTAVVFADHGGTLTWFGEGEHIVLDEVGELRQEGADLLIYLVDATLTSPFDAMREVDLELHLRHHAPPDDHPVFTKGRVNLFIQPAIASWDQRGLDCVGDPPPNSYQSFRSETREGTWNGYTFSAAWYDTSSPNADIPNANEGSLEITMAPDGLHVLSYTFEKETRIHYSSRVLYNSESLSYSGTSIPETAGEYLPPCCYYLISGPVLNTNLEVFRERWSTDEDCVEFIMEMMYVEGDEVQIEFSN